MVDNKKIAMDMYTRKLNSTAAMITSTATVSDMLYTILKENSCKYECKVIGSDIFIDISNSDVKKHVICGLGRINSFNRATSISLSVVNNNIGVLHEITIPFEDIFVDNKSNNLKVTNSCAVWEENPSLNDLNALLHTVESYIRIWN